MEMRRQENYNPRDRRIIIITQARMTSIRLPGKIARKVLGKTLLEHHLERLERSKLKSRIVVATTENDSDNIISEICNSLNVGVYRGVEHDVLARYYYAAVKFDADIVVRVTSDCPLIDPEIVDKTIRRYLELEPDIDYVSNCRLKQTYPRGLDTEVFSFDSLKKGFEEACFPFEREHVTPFIWQNPERFKLGNIEHETDLSYHRWTVDTAEDFELIKLMISACYPSDPAYGLAACLDQFQQNPDWTKINNHVQQKKIQ
jgi:spore coat polysaccharide biosynthesis protein SpsF